MKKEISLYLIFGVLTTAIGVGTYALFLKLGLHYFVATSLSWVLAVLFAFLTNRKLVFESKAESKGEVVREGLSFFTSRLSTWAVETLGLILCIDGLDIEPMLSKYIMSVVVIVLNYLLSKFVVFKNTQ